MSDNGFSSFGDIFKSKDDNEKINVEKGKDAQDNVNIFTKQGGLGQTKKPPSYEWQDLALKIIKELSVPSFKRNSVFKICKDNQTLFVEQCFRDTKDMCNGGGCWKYFFKLLVSRDTKD